MASTEDTFARLVSLAVHDLRTPLATVSGFARTLKRGGLDEPAARYVEMMVAACDQLVELLEEIGLVARIEGGRWEPNLQEVDSLELARAAVEPLDTAEVNGAGAPIRVDPEAAESSLRLLARCAVRHGGVERVTVGVDRAVIWIEPITADAAPVLMREQLRDLGAAVAARIVHALGGTIELEGDRLVVRLPG